MNRTNRTSGRRLRWPASILVGRRKRQVDLAGTPNGLPPAPTAVQIETIAHAAPAPGATLDELESKLRTLGHEILEVDREQERITILHKTETSHLIVRPDKEN